MPARMERPPLIIIGHWAPTVRRRRIASVSWIAPETRAQTPNTISVTLIVEKTAMAIAPAAATLRATLPTRTRSSARPLPVRRSSRTVAIASQSGYATSSAAATALGASPDVSEWHVAKTSTTQLTEKATRMR